MSLILLVLPIYSERVEAHKIIVRISLYELGNPETRAYIRNLVRQSFSPIELSCKFEMCILGLEDKLLLQ